MFERFGKFTSSASLNATAEGLKIEGDKESLKILAQENGIDEDDIFDYLDGVYDELVNPTMAAFGRIKVEANNLKLYEIMNDWCEYIKAQCVESAEMCEAVMRSDKGLEGCIAEILKWSFKHQYTIPGDIVKAAGITAGKVTLGIPGMGTVKNIIDKYYLGK